MGAITPCLWFDGRAGEAAEFYTSLFPNSSIDQLVASDTDADDRRAGADGVFMAHITVAGQRMQLLNGGPQFPFTEAISFVYPCADQIELDRIWDALIADGGEESQCGWLRDRFGLSWQIIPENMGELLVNQSAFEAMYTMRRLDIAALEAARDSHPGARP
ncbi:MAG: VOC family protein [Acidobacteria bacterium]|nr:VOC family protein [Acidobacteriota bacterium]